ncbi:MAG: hypothetical protein EOO60_01500 [Hymenobacter sp.]|nr:MAG: hypothetical protein EOO60_01500 [Hymenobacter sp.]
METLQYLVVTPSLCVAYDTTNRWLYNQWLGMHDKESIRLGAEAIFACLAAHPCTKMLSDYSQLKGDWRPDVSAVVYRNFERLTEHGISYVAWVCSFEYADRMAMEQLLRELAQPTISLFDEVASAYDWLLQCPAVKPRSIPRAATR